MRSACAMLPPGRIATPISRAPLPSNGSKYIVEIAGFAGVSPKSATSCSLVVLTHVTSEITRFASNAVYRR